MEARGFVPVSPASTADALFSLASIRSLLETVLPATAPTGTKGSEGRAEKIATKLAAKAAERGVVDAAALLLQPAAPVPSATASGAFVREDVYVVLPTPRLAGAVGLKFRQDDPDETPAFELKYRVGSALPPVFRKTAVDLADLRRRGPAQEGSTTTTQVSGGGRSVDFRQAMLWAVGEVRRGDAALAEELEAAVASSALSQPGDRMRFGGIDISAVGLPLLGVGKARVKKHEALFKQCHSEALIEVTLVRTRHVGDAAAAQGAAVPPRYFLSCCVEGGRAEHLPAVDARWRDFVAANPAVIVDGYPGFVYAVHTAATSHPPAAGL